MDRRQLMKIFCLDHIPLANDRFIIYQITGIKSQRIRYIGWFREISIHQMPWGIGYLTAITTPLEQGDQSLVLRSGFSFRLSG